MPPAVPLRAAVVALSVAGLAGCASATSGPRDGGSNGSTLRVSGSTTVNPVAADAAQALRSHGMKITVDSQGGSAGGIAQLARGQVDIAMSSKAIDDSDRRMFPAVNFRPIVIGYDAVGIVVRREVAEGGVTNLTREQARAIFEGRVTNWRQIGGPDLALFVYNKEEGRGTREQLDKYLYGDAQPPPPPSADNIAVVGGNEEGRTKLLSTPGSVGPLSTSFLPGHPEITAVALDGVEPSVHSLREGRYPMSRPLYLVTNGPATGSASRFIDYVLSSKGQELVRSHGYLTLDDLGLS